MNKLISQIGTIDPPDSVRSLEGDDPSGFIAGFVSAAIDLLLIIAFIITLIWLIFAGFRFITAGGDPKSTGQAWTQIYWGLIGMVVVIASFAIIKLIEAFFGIEISGISSPFQLPTGR